MRKPTFSSHVCSPKVAAGKNTKIYCNGYQAEHVYLILTGTCSFSGTFFSWWECLPHSRFSAKNLHYCMLQSLCFGIGLLFYQCCGDGSNRLAYFLSIAHRCYALWTPLMDQTPELISFYTIVHILTTYYYFYSILATY